MKIFQGKKSVFLTSILILTGFLFVFNDASAQSWSESCSLTSECDGATMVGGHYDSEGWHPDSEEAYLFYSSSDSGVSSLDVGSGSFSFKVKGLDIDMPFNWYDASGNSKESHATLGGISNYEWTGCKSDFWFRIFRSAGHPIAPYEGQDIWVQGFDFATKYYGTHDFSGWHTVETTWDSSGWCTSITSESGWSGRQCGNIYFELTPRTEDIAIGVGATAHKDGFRRDASQRAPWGGGLYDIEGGGAEDVIYKDLEFSFSGSSYNPNATDSDFCSNPSDPGSPADYPGDYESDYSPGEVPCGCVQPDNTSAVPCSEKFQESSSLSQDPAWFFFVLGWYWDIASGIDFMTSETDNDAEPPAVTVEAGAPGLVPGTEAMFVAAAEGYRTRLENLFYSWCIYNSVTGETNSYNPVVAGGSLAEKASFPPLGGSGSCCDWLTRTPTKDDDGDGMDDEWENIHFAGKTNPSGGTYIDFRDVDPNDDPDKDGFYASRFRNDEGGYYVTSVPGFIDSLDNRYAPGGSDGKLTNIEEYIIGTNPLISDTDSDGTPDEQDYIGVQQYYLRFTIDESLGQIGYLDITAKVVGIDQRKLVTIGQDTDRAYSTSAEVFRIDLDSDSSNIPIGADVNETVTLSADIIEGELDEGTLAYYWELQGEDICDDAIYPDMAEFCGVGKKELVLGGEGALAFDKLPGIEDLEIGGEYNIEVTALDVATRQKSVSNLVLIKADSLVLTTDCSVTGSSDGEDLNIVEANGEPTTICISDYGVDISNEDELVFQWYEDGKYIQSQSGIGKKDYEIYGNDRLQGDMIDLDVVVRLGEHEMEKEIKGNAKIEVVGPEVVIDEPAARIKQSDSVAGEDSRYLEVSPGERIALEADANYFPQDTQFTWYWEYDDQEEEIHSASDNSLFYIEIDENAEFGEEKPVSVTLKGEEGGNIYEKGDIMSVVVSSETGVLGAERTFLGNFAAAFSFLDTETKLSIQVALIIVGFALLAGVAGIVYKAFFLK